MLNRFSLAVLTSTLLFLAGCNQTAPIKKQEPASTTKPVALNLDRETIDKLCTLNISKAYAGPEFMDVFDRMRAGYQLTLSDNKRVQKHFDWYKKHPEYIARVAERSRPFMHYIVSELEKRNMPMELALLPIVESAFDPFAYSHGRASGMWQFIPGTGLQYGLKQNWWYDGRRDPMAATDAALDFLSDLHRQMNGDWLLALASYNTGPGNVRKAQRRNQRKGLGQDYWSLDLPRETEAYVPQLIALAKLFIDPVTHQLTIPSIPNTPFFEAVDTGVQIDLAQAANLAGLSLEELYKLNAGFNRWATDPQGPHRLLVPVDKVAEFRQALALLPADERVTWERYRVKSGDSLILIAKHFHTTVDVIKTHNKISTNMIKIGQTLLIPTASQHTSKYSLSASQRLKQTQQKSTGAQGSKKVNYLVQSGDSFWSIAKKYKVRVSKLAKWNGMAPKDTLKKGQRLVIWSNEGDKINTAVATDTSANAVIRKVAYRVRQGDSLARIAGKFNLSVNDIKRWNTVNEKAYIHPGQSLTLFVDVTRVR